MMFVGSFKGSETCSKNLVKWEYPVRKRGFVVQIMIEELTASYVMPHVSPPSSTQLSFLLYLVYTSRIETILLMRRSAEFRSITPTSLS
jgi:hypothetical protein